MRLYGKTFNNEFGREIRLTIASVKAKVAGPSEVVVIMEGPESTSENRMTLMEAVELREALRRCLK